MPKFTLTIDCDNAAFGEDDYARAIQISHILRDLADVLRYVAKPGNKFPVRDTNGNRVGEWRITDGEG